MKSVLSFVLIVLISPIMSAAQSKPATDYLNVPGPLNFNNQSFGLIWSAHPQANYYKQEYLVKGDKVERYKTMLMVELVTGNFAPKDLMNAKITELKQMKQTNPIVNFESFENKQTGEFMLDFLVSANDAQGNTSIVERNVYKYKAFSDKKGNKGVVLFAASERGYAPDIEKFLVTLKSNKSQLQNTVSKFILPEISVK